jgi:hypothetical protein
MQIESILTIAQHCNGNVIAGMASEEDGDNGILLAAIDVTKDGREQRVIDTLVEASLAPVKLANDDDAVPAFPEADTVELTFYTKVDDHIIVNACGLANTAALESALDELTDAFTRE